MQVTLPYGRDALDLRLPPGCTAERIEPPSRPALADPAQALLDAVEKPIAGPPLADLLSPGYRVAVVVADWTRACDYPRLLPPLLDTLNGHGVPDDAISLLVAYGTHARQPDDATRTLYGEAACRRVGIVHHDCDAADLIDVGTTPAGTRVRLNPDYTHADVTITLGAVGFHYFAGFGGGPKLVFPGLGGRDGIAANHARYIAQMLDAPQRLKARIDGNACAQDIRAAVRLAPPVFSIHGLFNTERELADVVAGAWDASHDAACTRLCDTAMLDVGRRYNLVVASCGGWPRDINLIQAHKSIDNACELLSDGGALLIAAECSGGVGSDTFLAWFNLDEDAFTRRLLDRYELHGGTALAMRRKAARFQIYMKSALPRDIVRRIGATPAADMQAALDELLAATRDPAVAVLPNAAETVARALPPS